MFGPVRRVTLSHRLLNVPIDVDSYWSPSQGGQTRNYFSKTKQFPDHVMVKPSLLFQTSTVCVAQCESPLNRLF